MVDVNRRMFSEDYIFPYEEGYEAFYHQDVEEQENPYSPQTQEKEHDEWLRGFKEAEQDSLIDY